MAIRHAAALLLVLSFSTAHLHAAQAVAIRGIVVDARTGAALAGVRITVDGQPVFTETTADGRFAVQLPPGAYTLSVSLVGYSLVRLPIELTTTERPALTIELFEGAGQFADHVTVAGAATGNSEGGPLPATLYGRELQALRGVVLDDPLRALHALPSVAATDDFYSEFAVRGLGFRHTGVAVDGMPSSALMHAVHGVSDGGSIVMINSDAVGSLSLSPGSYPQRLGRRIGAQAGLTTRDGDRERTRARAGLSGTSATILAEGPLGSQRAGSWLVSGRRSYLDLILNRIEDDNQLAFGFTDTEAKLVYDITPRHQIQALVIAGMSTFTETAEDLGLNDEARVSGRSWLSGLTWRYTPSARAAVTARVYTTGLSFDNINHADESLEDSRTADVGWRVDATLAPHAKWLIDLGGDVQWTSGRHLVRRSLNDAPVLTPIGDYDASGRAASAYAFTTIAALPRLSVSPGVRIDRWSATDATTASPWIGAGLRVTAATEIRVGGGLYQQFADLEQILGVRGGGATLQPERARHVDVMVTQSLPLSTSLQASWFARDEGDVLWTPGAEPRRLENGSIYQGRGDAPWVNALDGRARGVEILLRRDAPGGLSGWAGYAYNRHRYTEIATSQSFWSDFDQRHALSLFGHYRISNRSTVGAKFRYGSNYPRVGYIAEQAPPSNLPPLFGGDVPLSYGVTTERNTVRLPSYARLDLRADRTFSWSGRRMTLFVEIANALNHHNERNVPYDVDRFGRVLGGTGTLLPILPSAGFVIEF